MGYTSRKKTIHITFVMQEAIILTYPEERYSGKRDIEWYNHLVTNLKLEDILAIKSEG